MFLELAAGSWLVGNYIYHRWIKETPKPQPAKEIRIPRVDEGAAIPLVYGRCRVRQPYLAWCSPPSVIGSSPPFQYSMSMHFILGIPIENGSCKLHRVYVGDVKLTSLSAGATHGAVFITDNSLAPQEESMGLVGQFLTVWDGRASQTAATMFVATQMQTMSGIGIDAIPAYRGVCSVHLYGGGGGAGAKWSIGYDANMAGYSFEMSVYPGHSGALNVGIEMNPAWVLYDLLTARFGKLNLPSTLVDFTSFGAAAQRLQEEGNGYSRSIDVHQDANEIIKDLLIQIDGMLYEDPVDGKIHLKLVRGDYSASAAKEINPSNCEEITGFAAGGWEDVVNQVRVSFPHRDLDYQDGSATAHNQAAAAGQDGQVREVVIRMEAVCTQANANAIAARELNARSRPIAKCSATVDRSFYHTVQGDVVRVTWPEYGLNNKIFRVAAVNRGTHEASKIKLDLIEDFYDEGGSTFDPFPGDIDDLPVFEAEP